MRTLFLSVVENSTSSNAVERVKVPRELMRRNECFVGGGPEARRVLYGGNVVTADRWNRLGVPGF